MERCRISIIGDVILDINYTGNSSRIAQEACIPIVKVDKNNISYSLGGAANVYHNLLSMGLNARLITVIGTDESGQILYNLLEDQRKKFKTKWGITPAENIIIQSNDKCTTIKNRFYVDHKIIFRYDTENTNDICESIEFNIIKTFKDKWVSCEYIILSDYDKGVLTSYVTRSIIEESNKNNCKVFVDPKIRDFSKYSNCFLIKPNKDEGERICNFELTDDKICDGLLYICNKSNSQNCLLTLGERGIALYQSLINNTYMSGTCIHNLQDITGAGDVVMAALVYNFMKSKNLCEAAHFANYCGQLKVTNLGTYAITPYDVLMYNKITTKIIKDTEIERTIQIIKDANKKIVFTNGCYDILHCGHLEFLEEAKTYGDILIVALNTDDSIKRIKGDKRPINTLNNRIRQMNALKCVDFIVSFNEISPFFLIKRIMPDVLIKGGDYLEETIIGKEFSKKTIIGKYNNDCSTTNIIEQIIAKHD